MYVFVGEQSSGCVTEFESNFQRTVTLFELISIWDTRSIWVDTCAFEWGDDTTNDELVLRPLDSLCAEENVPYFTRDDPVDIGTIGDLISTGNNCDRAPSGSEWRYTIEGDEELHTQIYDETVVKLINIRKILNGPFREEWIKAIEDEIKYMGKISVWKLIDLLRGRRSKLVLKTKLKVDGTIEHYKIQMVAKVKHNRKELTIRSQSCKKTRFFLFWINQSECLCRRTMST